jgi:hypothetical protein
MDEIDNGLARRTTILAYCVAQRWSRRISASLAKKQNMHRKLGVQITFAKTATQAQKIFLKTNSSESHAPAMPHLRQRPQGKAQRSQPVMRVIM